MAAVLGTRGRKGLIAMAKKVSDEDWAKTVVPGRGGTVCRMCQDKLRERFVALLKIRADNELTHITRRCLYDRLVEIDGNFKLRVSYESFQRHLRLGHEPSWEVN